MPTMRTASAGTGGRFGSTDACGLGGGVSHVLDATESWVSRRDYKTHKHIKKKKKECVLCNFRSARVCVCVCSRRMCTWKCGWVRMFESSAAVLLRCVIGLRSLRMSCSSSMFLSPTASRRGSSGLSAFCGTDRRSSDTRRQR